MAGGVTEPRAGVLRQRYHELFADLELPVPAEAIAEDLLGLSVADVELEVSGLLLPAERQVYVNGAEPAPRRRFTLAHELGHWVSQCLEGKSAPVYCRASDVAPNTDRALEREANVFAAELLMAEPVVREQWQRSVTVDALATRFGVSAEAMHWRMYSFDLADRPVCGRGHEK